MDLSGRSESGRETTKRERAMPGRSKVLVGLIAIACGAGTASAGDPGVGPWVPVKALPRYDLALDLFGKAIRVVPGNVCFGVIEAKACRIFAERSEILELLKAPVGPFVCGTGVDPVTLRRMQEHAETQRVLARQRHQRSVVPALEQRFGSGWRTYLKTHHEPDLLEGLEAVSAGKSVRILYDITGTKSRVEIDHFSAPLFTPDRLRQGVLPVFPPRVGVRPKPRTR